MQDLISEAALVLIESASLFEELPLGATVSLSWSHKLIVLLSRIRLVAANAIKIKCLKRI